MDLITVLTGFAAGLLGAMGLGGGSVLLICLTAFGSVGQLTAQGINLLFFIPVALTAVIIYSFKKQIIWKAVLKMWLGGAVGVALGFFTAQILNTELLSKIFGMLLIFYSLLLLFKRKTDEC